MFEKILDFFRKRRIRRYASDIETSLLPLSEISSVNVIIDVEEPGFDKLKEDILSWGRSINAKVNIYFFDFRRLGKDELLLTSITNTLLRKELDWIGMPDLSKISQLMEEKSDLLISMVGNGDFPIDFVARCTKARFKIGRHAYEGNPFNMIISGSDPADLRSESRMIFAAMTNFLTKIK